MTERPPLPDRPGPPARAPLPVRPAASSSHSAEVLAIQASDVRRTFRTDDQVVEALRGVDLTVRRGEIVAIVGRSGAGKSTLLNAIGALDRGYTGGLRVFGQELRELDDRALSRFRNRQIGFVFQAFNLLPNLCVGDNVMLPAAFGSDHADATAKARRLLDEVGLADRWNEMPQRLSGGERQRVAIARALLLDPALLVCDEPTGSLDGETAARILEQFRAIRDRNGTTLIWVTHDPTVAGNADRIVTLRAGRIVVEAPAS